MSNWHEIHVLNLRKSHERPGSPPKSKKKRATEQLLILQLRTHPDGLQHANHGRLRRLKRNKNLPVKQKPCPTCNHRCNWTHRRVLCAEGFLKWNEWA